jgi:hypothetical protein
MEPTNSAPTQNPIPVTPATPPVSPTTTPNQNVVVSPKKSGMGGKKGLIILLAALVLLVVLGGAGYYYYANMMNKNPEVTAVPTLQPEPTEVMPTEDPDAITDESQLDGVVDDLDNATDEANMNQEVQGLQSDSNF